MTDSLEDAVARYFHRAHVVCLLVEQDLFGTARARTQPAAVGMRAS